MKKLLLFFVVITLAALSYTIFVSKKKQFVNPKGIPIPTVKPLLAYTFEKLRETKFPQSQIKLDRSYSETADSTSQIFYFGTPKKPGGTVVDKVSGLLNIPKKPGVYPVIVMFRGYVSEKIYEPGVGTQHVAEALTSHGFITLAPDFLGMGESNLPSTDSFEARFQTYTTALTLLSSLSTLNDGLQASYSGSITADLNKIGVWGHSNGGHIALSIIAINGAKYPTVLWAPVSKSFPYSILYYSDDADDLDYFINRINEPVISQPDPIVPLVPPDLLKTMRERFVSERLNRFPDAQQDAFG